LKAIRLVAFDLDDTLFPERAFVRSGFRVVSNYLQQSGLVSRPLWPDLEAAFDSGVRGHVFEHVLGAAGVQFTEAVVRTLVEVYRSHRLPSGPVRPDIRFYPDVERTLADLSAAGLRLGVISDGPLAAQRVKVEALGLESRVDAVILTDAWGRAFWKPHPRAFTEIAERLAAEPAACVYVADNPAKDFHGPAAAGWAPSIRITRPDGLYGQTPGGAEAAAPSDVPVFATIQGLDGLADVLARLSQS
jgi:putative hydrolase of the HAD superfamily